MLGVQEGTRMTRLDIAWYTWLGITVARCATGCADPWEPDAFPVVVEYEADLTREQEAGVVQAIDAVNMECGQVLIPVRTKSGMFRAGTIRFTNRHSKGISRTEFQTSIGVGDELDVMGWVRELMTVIGGCPDDNV